MSQNTLQKQKAVVLGATGYVGNAVVQHLVARGVLVVAHVREESRVFLPATTHFEDLGAKVVHTAWESGAMTELFDKEEPTMVFGCLGTTRARRRAADDAAKETYKAVDYGLTRLAIDAALGSKAEPKFIYLSALGASRKAKTEYLYVRGELEQYLKHCGLRYAIARPGIITGDDRRERRPLERVAGFIGDGFFDTLGLLGLKETAKKYHSFTALELADAMVEMGLRQEYTDVILEADVLHDLADVP